MNKKIFAGAMLAFLILCTLLSVPQTAAQKNVTIVDSVGNEVEIPYPVERIASLNPLAVEVICALGGEDKLVGVDYFTKWNSEFNPTMRNKPVIGYPMGMPPNYEKIIDLNPQVVISFADPLFFYPYLEDTMRSAGIKVLRLDLYKPNTFAGEVSILGQTLGKEERAKEYIDFSQSYVKEIEERVKAIPTEERVKGYYEWIVPYFAFGKGTGPYQLITMAGGEDIFQKEGGQVVTFPGFTREKCGAYSLISPEWIVEQSPQVMIKDYMDNRGYMMGGPKTVGYTSKPDVNPLKGTRNEIMNRNGFKEIDAVKNGNVHVFVIWELATSPRWPVGLGYIAKWCYPDKFKDLDPQAFHREWLKKWHGLDYKGVYAYP